MADFTEKQVYEALGVTPEGEGAKAQDPATPATQTQTAQPEEGAREQEPAAPAPDSTNEPQQPEGDGAQEGDQPQEGSGEPALTEQQRKENAAQRRRAETQAAIDKAVQDALKAEQDRAKSEMAAFFAAANLKNTITGAPITNMEEFKAWKQAYDAAQLQKDLKAGKLTPESLQKVIDQTPAMQKVQQMAAAQDEAKRAAEMAAAKVKIDAELAEIQKMDPSIQSVQDLLKMPKAKEFYEYVRKGNSFIDAYYLSHREELEAKRVEAARQQAQTLSRSKDHLSATAVRGAGAASVPAEDMAMFREFNPGATEAEIQAYYNKYQTKQGG